VLRFTLTAGAHAPKLSAVTIVLPKGLRLGHAKVSLRGARLKSVRLAHGRIVITVRRPSARFTVTVGGLKVTPALTRHKTKRLAVAIITRDARGLRSLLSAVFAIRA
jgi:hypothetical protein